MSQSTARQARQRRKFEILHGIGDDFRVEEEPVKLVKKQVNQAPPLVEEESLPLTGLQVCIWDPESRGKGFNTYPFHQCPSDLIDGHLNMHPNGLSWTFTSRANKAERYYDIGTHVRQPVRVYRGPIFGVK